MNTKKILPSLLCILFLMVSVGYSQIITSKKEAEKKGIYKKPKEKIKNDIFAENSDKAVAYNEKKESKKATFATSKSKKSIINEKEDNDLIFNTNENYLALQLINNAMQFMGVRYRSGGTSTSGMDCSGMVTAVFNIFDLKLPRSSSDMAKIGEKRAEKEYQKGDLIFFKTNGRDVINHVGMIVDVIDDEIQFIHSSTSKGVIISSTKEPYYKKTFAQVNKVL